MPQINNGKSPPWVAGEIVTAAELNGMIDSATINPSVITDQPNFTTLTGDEYALIVDPVSGNLKKTQLKNSLLAGEDIKTDSITQVTGSSAILTIESNPSVAMLLRGTGGLGLQTETGGITLNTIASGGTGSIGVQSNGMTFDGQGSGATGVIDFQTRTIFSYTSAIKLPVGTTAQRPATPVAGDTRFNSTTSKLEFYNGTAWVSSITSSSGTSTYLLYEIYEETIPESSVTGNTLPLFTSSTITKPTNEMWIFEVVGTIATGSTSSELLNFKLDSIIKWNFWYSGTYSPFSIKWIEGSASTYTSKTVTIDMSGVGVASTISPSSFYFPACSGKLRIYKHRIIS